MRRAWEHLNLALARLLVCQHGGNYWYSFNACAVSASQGPEPSRRWDAPQPVYTESGNFIVPVDHPHTRLRPPSCVLTLLSTACSKQTDTTLRRTSYGRSVVRPRLYETWHRLHYRNCDRVRDFVTARIVGQIRIYGEWLLLVVCSSSFNSTHRVDINYCSIKWKFAVLL